MDMDIDMPSSSTAQPKSPFDGLVTSYPPSQSTEPWDIFVNHCGKDVKHTLASAIYNKLHSMGFRVFLDKDALQLGDSFPAELEHAIATATLHIAIFSPNYAHSPWCLDELSSMLKTGAKIIPIFYYVNPSDLRWIGQGKGEYATAFSEHENKGRYTQEKLAEWKNALCQISSLHGYAIEDNKDEATVLKSVVNYYLQFMKRTPLWVAEHPLALDELAQGFESVATKEGVRITGIVGMGGIGKTTLAKELYNRNFPSFESCSFVSDVRDAASKNALCEKQKKLLSDLGLHHLPFGHVDEGKVVLENLLSSRRALIVLDDVDHIDQLNALLPSKQVLGSQIMVIVTTRELRVLKSWGLNCIYHMPPLANPHAKELFCWHAFLQPSPPVEFETLVEDFLKPCNGLPLSLKVLGAQLYGNESKDYWESQLNKILRTLPDEIQKRLRVSYDGLDKEDREMFLDVACFFIGEEKSRVVAVWDGSGWSGLHGLDKLVNKCLVEFEEGRFKEERIIRMHDHLRDMGREIASTESPYRLWCPQQIDNLKKDSTGIKQIRGIRSVDTFVAFEYRNHLRGNSFKEYLNRLMRNSSGQSECLTFSNELKILSVEGEVIKKEFAAISANLVWLEWRDFPLKNLPSWLTLKNLRVLILNGATELEELWPDDADPPLQLRVLILRDCPNLRRLPSSLRRLQHLKRLDAEFGSISLSEEFCGLQSLECLRFYCSYNLSSLPVGFGNLTSLSYINLHDSKQLTFLPNSFSQLIHLEDLDLSYCVKLSSLPSDIGNLRSLRNINLECCRELSMLPDSFSQLTHLETFLVRGCEQLSSLPRDLELLIHLQTFEVGWTPRLVEIESLPMSLKILRICYCNSLKNMRCISGLIKLEQLEIVDCSEIEKLPSFAELASLRSFEMRNCPKVEKIQGLERVKSLERVIVHTRWRAPGIQSLESVERLKFLDLRCESISAVRPCILSIKDKEFPTGVQTGRL